MTTEESSPRKTQGYDAVKWPGLDVAYLVYETDDYIVFIDSEVDVDWQTTRDYDKQFAKDPQLNEILNQAAIVECIPNDQHAKQIRVNFKRMIGEGLARALDHDYDNGAKILDKAEHYINNRNIEAARLWQLTTSVLAGTVSSLLAILSWISRDYLILLIGETGFFIFLAAFAGAIGATASAIFRMGKAKVTSEAIKKLHILESLSRILGGVISGIAMSFFVKLGIVVPIFGSLGNTHLAMIAAGLIAGGSERWVPSLIAKIDNSSVAKKEKIE